MVQNRIKCRFLWWWWCWWWWW